MMSPATAPTGKRDGWDELADAIVKGAALDYLSALKELRRRYRKGKEIPGYVWGRVYSEEVFFRSAWCEFLTPIDGEILIKRLRRSVFKDGRMPERKESDGKQLPAGCGQGLE